MGKREISFVHLHVYKDRHGKARAYYKPQGGKGIALPLPVGSPEFLLAYAKALAPVRESGVTLNKKFGNGM